MNDPEFHDAANIFPLDEENIGDLAADIKKHGQRVPIEMIDGKILDGRRRFIACKEAGVEPLYKTVQMDDPVAYVLSLNLYRRQLTAGQRSMVGAKALDVYKREAKERMQKGGESGGKGRPKQGSDHGRTPIQAGRASERAGAAVGVSGRSVERAAKVLEKGAPEVIRAVEEGRMGVKTAAVLCEEPEEVQRKEADNPVPRKVAAPEEPESENSGHEIKGVGVFRANEAINCLIRIPKNDPLRTRGFQIVTDWIKANKGQ